MTGEQRAFQLREHGVLEPLDAGPRIATSLQRREQIGAQLLPDGAVFVPAGAQLPKGVDGRWVGAIEAGHALNATLQAAFVNHPYRKRPPHPPTIHR